MARLAAKITFDATLLCASIFISDRICVLPYWKFNCIHLWCLKWPKCWYPVKSSVNLNEKHYSIFFKVAFALWIDHGIFNRSISIMSKVQWITHYSWKKFIPQKRICYQQNLAVTFFFPSIWFPFFLFAN